MRFVAGRGQESFLVVVGLNDLSGKTVQRVCHINIERLDSVSTIDSTPVRAFVSEGAAACVMGNNLYAVGIGCA